MLKKLFCIVLCVTALSVFADDVMQDYFPGHISNESVSEYIQGKKYATLYELQNEYEYILNFLDEAMNAHKQNINNYFEETSLVCLYPTTENGKLIIKEVINPKSYVNKETKEFYDKADINVLLEHYSFLLCVGSYNQLIDRWFEKTGIILRDKYNYDKEDAVVWASIESRDKYLKKIILTPDEFETYIEQYGIRFDEELGGVVPIDNEE